ncbi:hypothetical protein OG252_39710 [Streptomyces sp. NBC_01352]|uniref:hypothetical protein n=1 Tax=Streptomyces sp. NBC_01352 TaxID=2903834 RepID=UPI002E302638|nr:hypothetical protein [Streptomyces sp. NBC_01352]
MSDLSDYERRYLSMLDELQHTPAVEVLYEERGPVEEEIGDAAEAFTLIAEEEGVVLNTSLHRSFLRFEGLSSHWGVERAGVYLTGEFSVRHLAAAMLSPGVEPATDEPSDQELALYAELRPFDEQPRGGGGMLSALRIDPGMSMPEVWYYHATRGVFQMDLEYPEYLDALLVTKGVYGWQYLYTDVSMREIDFQGAAESIQNMLRIFPDIFPDHDYAPFAERLAERLR